MISCHVPPPGVVAGGGGGMCSLLGVPGTAAGGARGAGMSYCEDHSKTYPLHLYQHKVYQSIRSSISSTQDTTLVGKIPE